jgi:hypothetical protein
MGYPSAEVCGHVYPLPHRGAISKSLNQIRATALAEKAMFLTLDAQRIL